MGIQDTILNKLLLPRPRAISFHDQFQSAVKVLIAVSASGKSSDAKAFDTAFRERFKDKQTQLVITTPLSLQPSGKTPRPFLPIGLASQNLLDLWRNPEIKRLMGQHFDLLIDIDPNANAAYQFLCRRLNIPMRIALAKPHSDAFYNLEYTGRQQAPYMERLEGLLNFLEQFN